MELTIDFLRFRERGDFIALFQGRLLCRCYRRARRVSIALAGSAKRENPAA